MAQSVLVVDDDPVVHWVMGRLLGGTGRELTRANSGREALEMARRDRPQLIILDVLMPEMGGLTVLRQLKEAEGTKGIPVIVLTSLPQRTTELEATASGADGFLGKPFTEAQLLAAVRKLLPEPE